MRESALRHLACPKCHGNLRIRSVEKRREDILETAELNCESCQTPYPVIRSIPRFVPAENYAASFGFEWTKHARTQYDSYSGKSISEKRFFAETNWSRNLSNEVILEVGGGSGRFTEQAASTGGFVVSFDRSNAVDANYASNGFRNNVLILQADIFSLPFKPDYFDRIFCFGVLQHTPNARDAFLRLPPVLKPGGELVLDVYRKLPFHTKYLVRGLFGGFLQDMDHSSLYALTKGWVDALWPISRVISKIPDMGSKINSLLLIPDYAQQYGLRGPILKEWAYLDAFDMLSPRYDSPQTLGNVLDWFRVAEMEDINVRPGYNGIVGHGKKLKC